MLKHNPPSQRRSTQPTNTLHLECGEKYTARHPTFLHKDVFVIKRWVSLGTCVYRAAYWI